MVWQLIFRENLIDIYNPEHMEQCQADRAEIMMAVDCLAMQAQIVVNGDVVSLQQWNVWPRVQHLGCVLGRQLQVWP